jgi:hypothetical protein
MIVAELFMTLDGVVAAPQDWHGPYFDDEMGRRTEELLAASNVLLAKLVVTSTLSELSWSDRRRLSGDLRSEVAALSHADPAGTLTGGPA